MKAPCFAVPRVSVRILLLLAMAASIAGFPASAVAGGFNEEFSSPVLDPSWTVVPGARIASGFPPPANDYSLIANPGHLRYSLDAMTHHDGFLNGFGPTFGYHSCCTHDPGLELRRMFDGDDWVLESKVSYHMPFANGRQLDLRVYFGDGGPGTFYAVFTRVRDVHPFNELCSRLSERGASLPNGGFVVTHHQLPPCMVLPGFDGTDTTHYLRLERRGGVLTAMLSDDGVTWTTAWTHDFGTQLNGLAQRVVIAGLSWFVPAGSFADYDYVRLTVREPQHFESYDLARPEFAGETVTLVDQFGSRTVRLEEIEWLMNPVEKRRTGRDPVPITRPEEHLTCHGLPFIASPDRTVHVSNQFVGDSTLRIGRPLTLCVPAAKTLTGTPGDPPRDLQHYQCYDVRGETPLFASETLGLRDELGTLTARIDRARELCNPVEKRRVGRPPEPILQPEEHYVCYRIVSHTPPFSARTVFTRDQFRLDTLRVTSPRRLCVPSTKRFDGI